MDTVVGFILIGVISLLLVSAVTTSGSATRRINDAKTALRAAERALATLQQGQPAPAAIGDARIQIAPAPGATPPAGQQWLQVTATHNGRTATLVGLAPAGGAQ
jgi:type II secretory pathway pseudopilin PulG